MARRFTIGRDRQCDVAVADESVSRRHAEIWMAEDGTLRMADLQSSNGTKLIREGKSSVLKEAVVMAGDQVRMGVVTMGVDELIERLGLKRAARIRCGCGVLKTPGEVCLGCGGSNG
jgi:predicted component of type VI protein secretion system